MKGAILNAKVYDSKVWSIEVYKLENALDLINRLQEKNSNLTSDLTSLQKDLASLQAENERLKPFEDKIAEYNSHIRVEGMLVCASSLGEWLEFMQKTKVEAYKEFAEAIFELFPKDKPNTVISRVTVKHILKELVGDIE